MNRPEDIKITVATVTYNAESMLEPTLHSVEEQTHRNVEHLIVDGNSSDNTLELVREYLERNGAEAERHEIILVSEPDEGLYDAMNKALQKATGHYIVYMNAGDTFHSAEYFFLGLRSIVCVYPAFKGDSHLSVLFVDSHWLYSFHI